MDRRTTELNEMSVAAVAALISTRVQEAVKQRSVAREITAAQTRKRQVSAIVEDLRRLEQSREFVERETGVSAIPSGVRDFGDRARDLSRKYRAEPAKLVQPDHELELLLTAITAVVAEAVSNLKAAWAAHVSKTTRVAGAEFMVLEHVPTFRPIVRLLLQLQERARLAASTLPTSAQQLDDARAIALDFLTAWQSVDGVPANVLKFLTTATQLDGAPLDELTPDVRIWLTQNNLIGLTRVRISRGQ
jgi:hypothetical protein